jgi:D-alanyl-D-alanine carboxypeptidase
VLAGDADYKAFDKNAINPDVTVEQLLTMTSGIKQVTDYSTREYTALQKRLDWRPSEVAQLVETRFTPPGPYEYSNTNSILLGMIAEYVTGQQLNELYKSLLSDQLGIVAILLPQDTAPQSTARPYADRSMFGGTGFGDIMEVSHHGSDWYRATNKTTWAAAGIASTPENVARWAYELLSNKGSALSPATRAKLIESFDGPFIAIGGPAPEHQYGYHMTRTTVRLSGTSITAYGHPGMGAGYTSDLFYSPELDMAISLVANSHSNARSRAEAHGQITHQTLGQIARQIFESHEAR